MITGRHRSSATPLALAYAALLLYASLYPFEGWRWPPGQDFSGLLVLPWTRWQSEFDKTSNLLGYVPLGGLLCIAFRRSGWRLAPSMLAACMLPALLSYGTEVLQQFLPRRVPALEDFLLNAAGGAAGATLALLGHWIGLGRAWQAMRGRWITGDSPGALALLALWPVGLLFPAPLPLGLGQVGERLREALADALRDVRWAEAAYALLATPEPAQTTLRPLSEVLIIALGLLGPCLLAYSVMAPGWRRGATALGALALGVSAMAVSTLLNFGPEHAMAWLTPTAVLGLGLGLLLALALMPLRRRLVRGVALVVLTGLVVGVAQAPSNPYFAQSLQAWELGRFVRFHGLAQWVGWLWPYAAMLWLLGQLGTRDEGRQP